MDAFKLLTRSTKLKSSSTPSATPTSTRLPSAGKAENPQLFRDPNLDETGHGKKRKRAVGSREAGEEEEVVDASVDFFRAGDGLRAEGSTRGDQRKSTGNEDANPDSDEDGEESMDDEHRRTILNAHKIKVTDLRDFDAIRPAQPEEQPKKKKKRKSRQEDEPAQISKKEQKKARRLFPRPLVSFRELRSRYKISRRLAENIADQGFTVPTEVQLGSLPLLFGGSTVERTEPDLLVVAPTGSGKTLAFLIPVINNIVRHHHEQEEERGIFSVIVAPTKELAGQIVNEGRKLVSGTGVKITMMRKGMRVVDRKDDDASEQEDSEPEGDQNAKDTKATFTKSDILVTTPLLLVNALSASRTKPMATMPLVRNLVLDEADVLLDPLFREQTLDIWRSCTHPDLRASLWSATMGSNIEDLTKSTLKERQETLTTTPSPRLRLVVGLKDSAIPNIDHKLVYAGTEQGKLLGLRQLLHPTAASPNDIRLRPPFLIFTQTIPRAVALHSELRYDIPPEAGGSSRIAVLHSDLSDTQRSEIMRGFRTGEVWILVTTDLLARGVDFRGINGVVNYDIPTSAAVYVHRVGRTGRAGRADGVAVTYYTKEDIPYVKSIANIIDVSESSKSGAADDGADGDAGKSIQKWLLDALPDLTKKDKKELKKHGVKARQTGTGTGPGTGAKDGKEEREQRRTRISTKSGFERRLENRKKGAIAASQARKRQGGSNSGPGGGDGGSDGESWGGFED